MLATLGAPWASSQPGDGAGGDRGMGPLSTDPWVDPLNDLSHLYVPGSGLQGMEVSGGSAHLKTGSDDGWIASEIISAPTGHRYDFVLLEVDTPGASSFEVSILNASADPTEIGFANESIVGYKLRTEADLSVYSLSPGMYPEIRIQVNLHAAGTDRPSLLSWSLHFIGLDKWRDDFMGPGKMSDHDNLNFTGDELEINLTGGMTGGGTGAYDKYPAIATPTWSTIGLFYVNAGKTGYQDRTTLTSTQAWGVEFAHLNNDAYMELIYAERGGTSKIFWGTAAGTYSNGNSFSLTTPYAVKVASGDFNGDGWNDLAFACGGASSMDHMVFLNNGDGTFDNTEDITYADRMFSEVRAGDVNGDGYDDVMFYGTSIEVFYGSDTGPGTTADVILTGALYQSKDVDQDGIDDVIVRGTNSVVVYLGASPDIDTTADYTLSTGNTVYSADAGDINGDGDLDIVTISGLNPNFKLSIFEGDNGWTSARVHDDIPSGYSKLTCGDLDKDGNDDIVVIRYVSGSTYKMDIIKGVSTWPTAVWVTKDTSYFSGAAIAIPQGSGGSNRAYRGTFTTETISLPMDKKWDVAYLEGSFPQNTSMTISIIDDASDDVIAGFEDLAQMDADLSKILGSVTRIRIEVSIMSDLNTTTPVLEALTVKWMDKMVWRDEFFGAAKVERMNNLDVTGGMLRKGTIGGDLPQIIFPAIRGNDNYTTVPTVYSDAGGLDYLSMAPYEFITRGSAAVDTADINGDGFMDVAFAVKQTGDDTFSTSSPIFMGGPLGMDLLPTYTFPTHGATDVLLEDMDGDGYTDVVFAQEQMNAGNYQVNSTLFMGSADGWSDDPDFEFTTKGASGVAAADFNDDDMLDLVFSCYRDVGTSTDSMVFLQEATGWNGSFPDHTLPTKGAEAVATGDINDDDLMDVVFANSLSGGFAEVDSYIYWGKTGGGFDATPLGLPTSGASDLKVADLDGDSDLDIVFANFWDNSLRHEVDSFVYLNGGGGGFASSPDVRLPTEGASAVAVANLDATGRLDLVFACQENSTTYNASSLVYLGGGSGWSSTPDIEIPTEGASDVLVTKLFKHGTGGYMSGPIRPLEPRETGTFHTFRYTANLGASQSGTIQLVDAVTMEVLAETPMVSGSNVWDVQNLFHIKLHESIRMVAIVSGLDSMEPFSLDDLWMNWTKRIPVPPQVLNMGFAEPSVYRTQEVDMWVNVTDDYDLPEELVLQMEHRVNGTDTWEDYLLGTFIYDEASDSWKATVTPKVDAALGTHDFRVSASDLDSQYAPWLEFPNMLEIMNNVPTTPVVHIAPDKAVTTSTLNVEFDVRSKDIETTGLTYNFTWYRDGVLVPEVTGDSVTTFHTSKGENWTVEVRAWDGDEMSLPGSDWVQISNTPPSPKDAIPYPELDEDTVDSDWINLSNAFSDNDGDPIEWSLGSTPEHITVEIDHDTGTVTITPAEHWFGEESVTFVASDGEFQTSQTVTVIVHSVNDIPWFATVDGQPVEGDILEYTVKQGAKLVITYTTDDIEGDEIQADVSAQTVDLDETARTITFEPGVDAVGTFTFTLRIWDVESPGQKVSLSFTIEVENENDPMEEPKITYPLSGDSYKVNQSFSLTGTCADPDIQWGQELLFVWTSNISGELGRGSSITATIMDPGTHEITLTVSDPDYQKMDTIIIVIEPRGGTEPPPPPDDDDTGPDTNWALIVGIVVALAVLGAILYIATGKRRTERYEAKMDAEEDVEDKRQALERTRDAIKDLADEWEGDLAEGETKAKAEAAGWEAEGDDYKEIDMGPTEGTLTMEAAVTAEASDDVKKLFTGVGEAKSERSEEEKEAMRIENEKRQYQNAIGRLPYGIPSKELADMDWVDLANCLATCEKKTVEGGKEVAQIEGKWYYTDREDTGTFLKEHGAKKEERKPKAPSSDKDKLLAKLEERFILGEISEDTYKDLKKKYGG